MDTDGNGRIMSRDEFEAILICPEAAQFIEDVGVDVAGFRDYADVIFRDRELELHELVDLILQLSCNNPSKVKDDDEDGDEKPMNSQESRIRS